MATFAVLFEFLAFQLSSGNDPALGASALQVASTKKMAAATRPVIDRRSSRPRSFTIRPSRRGDGEQLGRAGLIRFDRERRPDDVLGERTRPGRRSGPGSRARPDRDRDVMSADVTFRAMGSEIRLIIGDPAGTGDDEPDANEVVRESREFIERYEACLSRFRPESELCALNADPRPVVPASPLLRDAVAAGVEAARMTDGLVDPTLVDEIEDVGYVYTREGTKPAKLSSALLLAPGRESAARAPCGAGHRSRSTRRRESFAARREFASTAAASVRAWPPTCWPSGSQTSSGSSSTAAVTFASAGFARAASRSSPSTR